jgi:type I restriction enzyme M protein
MGIVLPDGVLANDSMQEVRDWILRWARLKAVVSLPQETFAPYGAGVKTSVVFLEKRERPLSAGEADPGTWTRYEYTFDGDGKIYANMVVQNGGADYSVYMAQIQSIGYDATGRLSLSEEEAHFPPDVAGAVDDFGKEMKWG